MVIKDLLAFKKSFKLAIKIVEISNKFLEEEMYALVNQIKMLSRNVIAIISVTYRKQLYPRFISKLTDTITENSY